MKAAAIIFLLSLVAVVHGNWQEWWTYDGISGPGYWGVINPAWTLCNRGRHQVNSVVEFPFPFLASLKRQICGLSKKNPLLFSYITFMCRLVQIISF